jgi:hypothetical protein
MTIKDDILKVITRKTATCAELEAEVQGFAGDLHMGIQEKNWLYWTLSREAGEAILELEKDGIIRKLPCDVLCYHWDGMTLNLPLVAQNRSYKRPI